LASNKVRSLQRIKIDTDEIDIEILKTQAPERTVLKPKRFTDEMVRSAIIYQRGLTVTCVFVCVSADRPPVSMHTRILIMKTERIHVFIFVVVFGML
jgi:hypothetical protein